MGTNEGGTAAVTIHSLPGILDSGPLVGYARSLQDSLATFRNMDEHLCMPAKGLINNIGDGLALSRPIATQE